VKIAVILKGKHLSDLGERKYFLEITKAYTK
jgi:hypothetical protein